MKLLRLLGCSPAATCTSEKGGSRSAVELIATTMRMEPALEAIGPPRHRSSPGPPPDMLLTSTKPPGAAAALLPVTLLAPMVVALVVVVLVVETEPVRPGLPPEVRPNKHDLQETAC